MVYIVNIFVDINHQIHAAYDRYIECFLAVMHYYYKYVPILGVYSLLIKKKAASKTTIWVHLSSIAIILLWSDSIYTLNTNNLFKLLISITK